ncbi:MAG TPA: hypothetical protein PKN48_02960 [Bacteroidales bacterium]|nr:hypothetical protein [Bacteroidales bacterium]
MMVALKCVVLISLLCFQIQSFGQLMLDDIKPGQIQQRKIRKYIKCLIEEDKHQFGEIHPSWNRGKDLSSYSEIENTYILEGNSNDIWHGYISENPSKSWNGRKVSFGVLVQKFPGAIYYDHDQINGVDTGQVYFLNLKLLLGICNIPVAFEMITVDTAEKVIEFSYIEENKSTGVQQIKFMDMDDGHTKILHTSHYRSDSRFRDKWIYPFFHKKIVNDFHRNMRKLLNLKTVKIK